jgi:hypothetical protein
LLVQIFRFYYRCKNCAAEFTMKTDPKTSDYVLEEGASRNYEPWREEEAMKVEAARTKEEEERGNAMKALENRTLASKREMDLLETLDEMRSLRSRCAPGAYLAWKQRCCCWHAFVGSNVGSECCGARFVTSMFVMVQQLLANLKTISF